MGGDYKVTDQWTMRAGVAYDQTPTHNATRDPRIPDGDRYFASLGAGYRFQSMPELSIDAAYSRQFVKEVPLKTVNQIAWAADAWMAGQPARDRCSACPRPTTSRPGRR